MQDLKQPLADQFFRKGVFRACLSMKMRARSVPSKKGVRLASLRYSRTNACANQIDESMAERGWACTPMGPRFSPGF